MSIYRDDDPAALTRALASIFDQVGLIDSPTHRYLGIDGPVPDALRAVVIEFSDRIHLVHDVAVNRGLAHMLNDLIGRLGSEKFIFRMDADDVCFPERFAKQLAFMRHNPAVDILGTAICEVHANGTRRVVTYPAAHEQAYDNLYWRGPVAHPTVCFRRHVLDSVGAYPIDPLSEDIALWFECAARGYRFANIAEPLLYFSVGNAFWKRRGARRAWVEFVVWMRGIRRLHGVTWKYALPIARLAFRLSPAAFQRAGYGSALRRKSPR